MKEFVQTTMELAKITPRHDGGTGVSHRRACEFLSRHGIKKTKKGWPVVRYLELVKKGIEDAQQEKGLDADIKRRRLSILDVQLDRLRGEVIPRAEHLRKMAALQRLCTSYVDIFISNAASVTRDPLVLKMLKEAREKASQAIAASV